MTSATLSTPVRTPPSAPDGRSAGTRSRTNQRGYVRTLVVLDTAVLSLAVLAGYATRFGDAVPRGSEIPYVVVAPALVLVWLVSLKALRCYDDRVLGYGADEYRRVSGASLRLAGGVAIAGYIFDVGVSRGFLGISFAVGTVGLVVARFAARKALHRARSPGRGLVPSGPGRRGHRTRAGVGAHPAPGAVRRLSRGRRLHPGRAARPGAAAARATCPWWAPSGASRRRPGRSARTPWPSPRPAS